MRQLWSKTLLLSALALAATVDSYRSKRNGIRNNGAAGLLAFATLFLCLAVLPVHTTYGQTVVSGDVTGTVTDASGAAIPNVKILLKSLATGEEKVVTTSGSGNYRVPLLQPGQYSLTATLAGFQTTTTQINVSAGQAADGSLRMGVGSNAQTVEVTEATPLLHTEDAAISTTFDMAQIETLPNPGNDLTFIAQTAPGSVMNTQGGYGNFSSFGLPATSNTFTLNGAYLNDPYLNLNNSGATNLLLGNNDISSVTVTSPAYDASFGGLGGAQTTEISRGGTNSFHGNATYWWNGRIMNANDWFNKHAPAGQETPRSFDNANQWAGAIGGPIKKDKTFFFFNTEGLRVIIPVRGTVYAPSPQFQCQSLGTCPVITDPTNPNYLPDLQGGNIISNGNASAIPLYQRMYNLWNTAPGSANAAAVAGDPETVTYNSTSSNFAHEWLITGRIDQVLSDKDRLYAHVVVDHGTQPTFTSFLSPLFNVASPQPQYSGQLNETHSFSPNMTNQFIFAAAYYRAIFTNTNQAAANAVVPNSYIFLDGGLASNTNSALPYSGTPGGENFDFPQGRNVTGYQFIDDLSWTRGSHTLRFGYSFRRDDITDYGPSVRAITPEVYTTEADFAAGFISRYRQYFPARPTQPVAVYGEGFYAQDTWKMLPNLTLTLGMRFEHNSTPVCQTNCFANLSNNFFTLAAATTSATPYNQLIASSQHKGFPSFQTLGYEPRLGFAYLPFGPGSHTTIRGGFGMFADSYPGQIAGDLLRNPPSVGQFYLRGQYAADNAAPNSGAAAAAASNAAFVANYNAGASFNTLSNLGIGFVAPTFTSTTRQVFYPMYESWSLAVEQQLDSKTVVSLTYVGNHGYHEPILNAGVNAYGFGSLPAAAPQASFAAVTQVDNTGGSNYNGGVLSVVRRQKLINLQFNYMYSHAFDVVSNGGFNAFSSNLTNPENPYNVAQNYGPADYDIRNYISASYVINVPQYHKWGALTGNWTIGGTVFHSSGLPFTVTDSSIPNNYVGVLFAQQVGSGFSNKCQGAQSVDTPCPLGTAIDPQAPTYVHFNPASDFGQQRRNQFIGSGYTDTDLDLTKGFKMPHWESGNLKLGAQFFNLFNHPNFGQPLADVEGTNLGQINSLVSTPTSILGSFLGGDAAPRLIQLKANFTF
jgi:Carboxypeptidase regulatory-like domain